MNIIKKAARVLSGKGVWEVRRTIWPYPEGWGTYNPTTKTVLDTGLKSREEAQAIVDDLNSEGRN